MKEPKESPASEAKRLGCKSLTSVAEHTGQCIHTLSRWYRTKPDLFRTVCKGYLAEMNEGQPVKLTKEIRTRVIEELVSSIEEGK